MICERTIKKFCKEDISLIENYDKAITDDTQTWDCHHRRETVLSRKDLIEIGEYYNRPACELIFLTHSEHLRLHMTGNNYSLGIKRTEETKKKMIEANKNKHNNLGYHWYNNGKINILCEECPENFVVGRLPGLNVGRKLSEETKRKIGEANKKRS